MATKPPKFERNSSLRTTKVAPSLLAADPLRLGEELRSAEDAGCDWHHIDVMDGHFVPNLSYGLPLIRAIKQVSRCPLDVHIMVTNPDDVALQYVSAGANILAFHAEASRHPYRLCQTIRAEGAKAAIAINPGSPLEIIWPLLEVVDMITVMSVNPGFGGQSFIGSSIQRVQAIADHLHKHGLTDRVLIEVDGGINAQTGREVVAAGASVLVAGTYVYGAPDRAGVISTLKNQA